MGCDVHAAFEVKINNKWEHYSIPNINRNYALFEKMAGVRGDVSNAISPPKGLPDDISIVTKIDADWWNGDGHSHSWLSSSEYKEMYAFYKELIGPNWWQSDYERTNYLFGNGFDDFAPGSEEYPKELQDFRLVFWFDN